MPAKTNNIDANAWTQSNDELEMKIFFFWINSFEITYSGDKFAIVVWANFSSLPPRKWRFLLSFMAFIKSLEPCVPWKLTGKIIAKENIVTKSK